MYFLFKMGIFHCYVCLPEGTYSPISMKVENALYLKGNDCWRYTHCFYWTMTMGGSHGSLQIVQEYVMLGVCFLVEFHVLYGCEHSFPILRWKKTSPAASSKSLREWRICFKISKYDIWWNSIIWGSCCMFTLWAGTGGCVPYRQVPGSRTCFPDLLQHFSIFLSFFHTFLRICLGQIRRETVCSLTCYLCWFPILSFGQQGLVMSILLHHGELRVSFDVSPAVFLPKNDVI